jgi:hypothetical protein
MPSRSRACIYANPSQDFAKLTKMQSSFAKTLDRSFVGFFAKTGMQSPFAKLLELLSEKGQARLPNFQHTQKVGPLNQRYSFCKKIKLFLLSKSQPLLTLTKYI